MGAIKQDWTLLMKPNKIAEHIWGKLQYFPMRPETDEKRNQRYAQIASKLNIYWGASDKNKIELRKFKQKANRPPLYYTEVIQRIKNLFRFRVAATNSEIWSAVQKLENPVTHPHTPISGIDTDVDDSEDNSF